MVWRFPFEADEMLLANIYLEILLILKSSELINFYLWQFLYEPSTSSQIVTHSEVGV